MASADCRLQPEATGGKRALRGKYSVAQNGEPGNAPAVPVGLVRVRKLAQELVRGRSGLLSRGTALWDAMGKERTRPRDWHNP